MNVSPPHEMSNKTNDGSNVSASSTDEVDLLENTFGETKNVLWDIEGLVSSILEADDICMLLLAIQRNRRLTDSALDIVLKLFRAVLPDKNQSPSTTEGLFNQIDKWIDHLDRKICYEYFKMCSQCDTMLLKAQNTFSEVCLNKECKLMGKFQRPDEYTVFSIQSQIELIVMHHGPTMLKYLESLKDQQCLTDIPDGQKYASYGPNPINNVLWINLVLSADGARPINSRKGSLWPCDAIIAEFI